MMKWSKKGDQIPSPSMSFLADNKVTFHRFSDDRISFDRDSKTATMKLANSDKDGNQRNSNISHSQMMATTTLEKNMEPIWTTKSSMDYNKCGTPSTPDHDAGSNKCYSSQASTITSTNNGTHSSLNTQAIDSTTINTTVASDCNTLRNGSKIKLLNGASSEHLEDQTTKQSRCSIFRGVVLCLCLNLTYSNIVRFPRELERHGSSFLVPYLVLLFIIGLPLLLLEIALGQFLGQGSAHTWRASPFFKGASIVGRIASWMSTLWISMESSVALLYIGMLSLKSVPFSQCASAKLDASGYRSVGKSGQECLKSTFLLPVWKNSVYFGSLAIGLILIWMFTMICTHSAKLNRRSIFFFGFFTLMLLIFQCGWEVTRAINDGYFPNLWPFNTVSLMDSTLWFNALIQVIFSLNIGTGIMPVITGKFLYKSDAVKTSFVYICFNILITAIATIFYLMQFENPTTPIPSQYIYPELSTLTVIYDRALTERDHTLSRLIPGLTFGMIVLSSLISLVIYIYTATRFMRRHPNYTVCLVALVLSIAGLICPDFIISRLLDSRVVGSLIVCAMIVDVIGTIWIYGSKNLYTDLEFSIGRPIFKIWLVMWSLAPIVLSIILIWWLVSYAGVDLLGDWLPRWLPIALCLILIFVMACVEVGKEVDYNLCAMIKGATKPSKDWGPSDPLVRHAWKQWKSVCEDTGERDFTLRRRGTKDYTNSIKKGQYSHSNKYGTANRKHQITRTAETDDSHSPNYSGSVFGDSAIEEDISVDKYPDFRNISHYNDTNTHTTNSSPRISANSSRSKSSLNVNNNGGTLKPVVKRFPSYYGDHTDHTNKVSDYTSRIEITPIAEGFYKTAIATNTIPRVELTSNYGNHNHVHSHKINLNPVTGVVDNGNYSTYQNHEIYGSRTNNVYPQQTVNNHPIPKSHQHSHNHTHHHNNNNNNNNNHHSHSVKTGGGSNGGTSESHICWRKYTPHSDEFSTEL